MQESITYFAVLSASKSIQVISSNTLKVLQGTSCIHVVISSISHSRLVKYFSHISLAL